MADVAKLAGLDQILDCAGDIFDRHPRIDTMLVEQIDHLDSQSLERTFDSFLDVLRFAVQPRRSRPRVRSAQIESEFRRDHHLLAKRFQCFAHEFFVGVRAVNFSGIEERNAAFHTRAQKRNHLLFVLGRAVRKTHAHAAEPDRRYFQWIILSKFALLHF